ncbi:hypothetical protein [Sphingosinicella sp. CPCC 101087]|uniref:DUF7946 domain-containing protein n=1 Tax=Sphingosinicella sp. CPCC 101087 TaxID=2497754 RepID=UPI00101C30DD|nr:hypothetical protein [Sphingosinicella sp. CPCC 101087]
MIELKFHVNYMDGRRRFDGLDHYYGAQSLLGLSQMLLISLHAFFNRDIITQAPSAKGFRIVMGTSRRGGWDQVLHLLITNPEIIATFNDIGKNALYDLLKWALVSGAGVPFALKYRKSTRIARDLEQKNDDLQERLDEALKRVHAPVKHQGLTVHVMTGRTNLATFNESTLRYIETELVEDKKIQISSAVSRFNARTGTGRLIGNMDAVSVPFYPEASLSKPAIMCLADSLAALARDRFEPVNLSVSRVTSADGHLKSYRVHTAWR